MTTLDHDLLVVRATLRLASETLRATPGTDYGPDSTAGDASADVVDELREHVSIPMVMDVIRGFAEEERRTEEQP